MKRLIVLCLIVVSVSQCQYVIAQPGVTIVAPAVQRTPDGLAGVLSYITVAAQKGSGHIYIDTWPLAEVDIQGSARLAVQVACEVVEKDWNQYDFFITVRSDAPIIGGPSAGGVMTVAVIAALEGWELTGDVVMSGTINPDETVGPVGGLYQKAQAASQVADTFLVPEGQTTILVEEQQVVQEGIFTYIKTVQKEIDLVEEGRKVGLKVEEVYDIRDAVYHFTGKEIKIPRREAEPIKADFMNTYTESELEKIDEEYRLAAANMASYTGSYRHDLDNLLETAQEQITYAHTMYDSGNYYTSMSASYVAGLYITYVVNLLSYFEGETVEEIFSHLDDQLLQLSQEINQERPFGMTALQCLAAAQNRIFEAKDYYQNAQETRSDFNYIEYASYAQRRAESAGFWLDLARDFQKGDEITENTLKNAASSMFSTAELSLVYASSILPESNLLQEAETKLENAQKEFVDGAFCAALFSAIESKVHGEVALISYASTESMISQRIQRARERASAAIERSREQGIEPVLAVSYYELAESLSSSTQTLIYLGYAEETASIYRYIEGHPDTSIEITINQVPESAPEQNRDSDHAAELLFLGAGICLGIGICWVVAKVTQ